jgi:hypothetical protein
MGATSCPHARERPMGAIALSKPVIMPMGRSCGCDRVC